MHAKKAGEAVMNSVQPGELPKGALLVRKKGVKSAVD